MTSKILFISEALAAPFDEGIKNIAFSLHKYLHMKRDTLSTTKMENDTVNLDILKISLNKLFLNRQLRKEIRDYLPDVILYLPEASATFYSFCRTKVLKYMSKSSKVVLLATQQRHYSPIQSYLIANFFKPDLLLLLGKAHTEFFLKKGLRIKVLPPAVDCERFRPATKEEKKKIRFEYNISEDKTVVLHVGHIKTNRNIEYLLEIQKIEDIQVVIVGSTSITVEEDLRDSLVRAGIRVIDEFIPDVSRLYKMSDIYVFPVINIREAIDMPLSVLEAMACNLPVLTTRFSALIDYFEEDNGLEFFNPSVDHSEKIVRSIRRMNRIEINNNQKVELLTWGKFTDAVINACDELI